MSPDAVTPLPKLLQEIFLGLPELSRASTVKIVGRFQSEL